MKKLFVFLVCVCFASVAYGQQGTCRDGKCLQKVVEKSVSCEKGKCWLNGELTVTKEKQVTKTKVQTKKRFRLFRWR